MQSEFVEFLCWLVCFFIGLILFAGGFLYLHRKKTLNEEHLIKASLFEFVASIVLYLPGELFDGGFPPVLAVRILESIPTAIIRAFNIYLGGGYVKLYLETHPILSGLYGTLMSVTNIVMLLFVAGFLIQFLDGPMQRLKLGFRRSSHLYLFPDCNEKTLAIARSIDDQKGLLLFAYTGDSPSSDVKEEIVSLGGIYVNSTIETALRKTGRHAKKLEIFLFGDSEEKNLSRLEEICGRPDAINRIPTRIYVELSRTPWSLYDDFLKKHNTADGSQLVINFVRTEENFVYNDLLKHSIFENAVPAEKDGQSFKKIGVLIAGMNERNMEMFKAVLHLSQMPGYRLTVLVLDEDPLGWDRILQQIPEIHNCETEGNALYEHHYYEGVDFSSDKPETACDQCLPDFSFAFVNAGDDLLNLNLALRLQAYRFRRGERDGYQIQVNIRDRKICEHWSSKLTEHLTIIGDTADTYRYDFITMSDIERATIAIHQVRYPSGDPTWISYCNNEYNRHSVYARTLSFKYKVKLIDESCDGNYSITSTDRTWKIYEHMRWNVYTRTMGFVLADKALLDQDGNLDKTDRSLAKAHNDLVDFDQLPQKEQDKDALTLTPEVVKILKSI